jgi:chromatin segregation and condensation protein Rec8/ScpA/Scc1 (kleisin family)
LYLAQQNKIELVQETPFGEIEVLLKRKAEDAGIEQKAASIEVKAEEQAERNL